MNSACCSCWLLLLVLHQARTTELYCPTSEPQPKAQSSESTRQSTATALLKKTLDTENETLDLGVEGVLLKIPSALKIRKPGYPRPTVSFSYFGVLCKGFQGSPGSSYSLVGFPNHHKTRNARVSFSVRSGTKENKKMPESRFLI